MPSIKPILSSVSLLLSPVNDPAIGLHYVAWLHAGRTGTHVLLIHDHGRRADSVEGWGVGGTALCVRSTGTARRCNAFRMDRRSAYHALRFGLEFRAQATFSVDFAGRRSGFRFRPHSVVIGVRAADGSRPFGFFVARLIGGYGVDRPQAFL